MPLSDIPPDNSSEAVEPSGIAADLPARRLTVKKLGLLLLLSLMLAILILYGKELIPWKDKDGLTREQRFERDTTYIEKHPPGDLAKQMEMMETADEGITNFAAVPASDAKIDDNEPIFGVIDHGKARAYLREAFTHFDRHMVHDTPRKTAISITYCDKTDYLRVFRRGVANREILVGGWSGRDRQMLLTIDGKRYLHTSKSIPLTDYTDVTRCTWGEWKQLHPDTDIYLGPENSNSLTKQD